MTDDENTAQQIALDYSPRPWQLMIHQNLKRFNVLVVHRGSGKGAALDTPIATPDGFTTMGDIKVGDLVIDRDGNHCPVITVSEISNLPCYEVEFSTGEKFVCDEEHLWLTQTIYEKQNERNRVKPRHRRAKITPQSHQRGNFKGSTESVKNIREIMDTLEENYVTKDGLRQKNHRVRVVPPIQFPSKDLPIDPYLLGYWLGDGCSRNPEICVGHQDNDAFVEKMRALGIELTLKKLDGRQVFNYRFGSKDCPTTERMICKLRQLGVLMNKHIPPIYLRASLAQRWSLLQGLMDSDGHADYKKRGKCEYTTVLPELAADIHELLASLGIKSGRIAKKKTSINGVRKKDAYRVQFKGFADQPIFDLPRKKRLLPDRSIITHNYQRNRLIVAVNPVPSVPTRCIWVDSPSSTYCIGRSFIPTHNTVLAMNELVMKALTGPWHAEYLYVGPYKNQMMRAMWEPLKVLIGPIPGMGVNNNRLEVTFPNRSRITVLGADDPESLRGKHVHGIVVDEFGDMPPNIWPILFPMTTNHNAWVMFIGTPKGRNQFYEKFLESQDPANKDLWFGTVMPWHATKALADDQIAIARATLSVDMFAQEYECDWTASNVGAYYARQMTDLRTNGNIVLDHRLYNPELEVHCAFDIGMRDFTAVWWFQVVRDHEAKGDMLYFVDFEQAANLGLPDWYTIIKKKERDFGYRRGSMIFPHDVKVREWGTGISRIEAARKLGIHVEQCPDHRFDDRIEMVRLHLPKCKFDGTRCEEGIEALAQYREKTDRMGNGLGVPLKDGNDHAADSFGYGIVFAKQVLSKPQLVRIPFLRRR